MNQDVLISVLRVWQCVCVCVSQAWDYLRTPDYAVAFVTHCSCRAFIFVYFYLCCFWGLHLLSSTEGHFAPTWGVLVFFALVCWGLECIALYFAGILLLFLCELYCIVSHCLLLRRVVSCVVVSLG